MTKWWDGVRNKAVDIEYMETKTTDTSEFTNEEHNLYLKSIYSNGYENGAREAVAKFRKMFNSIIDNWEDSMKKLDEDRKNV